MKPNEKPVNADILHSRGYNLSRALIEPRQLITEVSEMRIKCPDCQHKATVYSRANTSDDMNSVYARCTNRQCEKFDHSFVSHVAFSHWINPKEAALQLTFEMLFDQLPHANRAELVQQLAARV